MGDEAAFLQAIAADPRDDTVRLVYADWLEERADPRFELVRVCQAMRAVPVYADEYWQLKARRNELLPQFDIDRLEATGYDGSRYDPVFRDGVPDDMRDHWRLIREFAERWHGIDVPDVGGRTVEIRAAEARLGLALPASVREFVAFAYDAGCRGTATYSAERPTPIVGSSYEVARIDGHAGMSLTDYDGDGDGVMVGVLYDYFQQDDPPTHRFFYHHFEYDQGALENLRVVTPTPFQPSVGLAILNDLTAYMPVAGKMLRPDDAADLIARLRLAFRVNANWDGMDIFGSDDIIVVIETPPDPYRYSDGPATRGARVHLRRPGPVGAAPDAAFGLTAADSGVLLFYGHMAPTAAWVSPTRCRSKW